MKMDMRNYTLQSRQPYLREHSIQRERAQFQECLSRQPGAQAEQALPPSRSRSFLGRGGRRVCVHVCACACA